jgi:hypothetical protein
VIPETLSEMVAGSTPATTSGMIDIRATYRGASIGTGLLLGSLASNSLGLKPGLIEGVAGDGRHGERACSWHSGWWLTESDDADVPRIGNSSRDLGGWSFSETERHLPVVGFPKKTGTFSGLVVQYHAPEVVII